MGVMANVVSQRELLHPQASQLSPAYMDNVPGLSPLRRCLVVMTQVVVGLTVLASKPPVVGLIALACVVTTPAPAKTMISTFKSLHHAVKMRVAVGKAVPAGR